jgi:hypothetical protein
MQTTHVAGMSQWFVTVLSGSTTLGYSVTATRRQRREPPDRHRYWPSNATAQPIPMTECRVAGDKTQRAHAIEDIIGCS